MRVEGSQAAPWGSIFPRVGFVPQTNAYKGAVVALLRAADIVTHNKGYHIDQALPLGCGAGCTILPSHENAAEQIKFQRLYPTPIETSYDPEAFHDDLNPLAGDYHQDLAQKGEDRFLWVMWRKYQGCVQAGGSLIKEIRW